MITRNFRFYAVSKAGRLWLGKDLRTWVPDIEDAYTDESIATVQQARKEYTSACKPRFKTKVDTLEARVSITVL